MAWINNNRNEETGQLPGIVGGVNPESPETVVRIVDSPEKQENRHAFVFGAVQQQQTNHISSTPGGVVRTSKQQNKNNTRMPSRTLFDDDDDDDGEDNHSNVDSNAHTTKSASSTNLPPPSPGKGTPSSSSTSTSSSAGSNSSSSSTTTAHFAPHPPTSTSPHAWIGSSARVAEPIVLLSPPSSSSNNNSEHYNSTIASIINFDPKAWIALWKGNNAGGNIKLDSHIKKTFIIEANTPTSAANSSSSKSIKSIPCPLVSLLKVVASQHHQDAHQTHVIAAIEALLGVLSLFLPSTTFPLSSPSYANLQFLEKHIVNFIFTAAASLLPSTTSSSNSNSNSSRSISPSISAGGKNTSSSKKQVDEVEAVSCCGCMPSSSTQQQQKKKTTSSIKSENASADKADTTIPSSSSSSSHSSLISPSPPPSLLGGLAFSSSSSSSSTVIFPKDLSQFSSSSSSFQMMLVHLCRGSALLLDSLVTTNILLISPTTSAPNKQKTTPATPITTPPYLSNVEAVVSALDNGTLAKPSVFPELSKYPSFPPDEEELSAYTVPDTASSSSSSSHTGSGIASMSNGGGSRNGSERGSDGPSSLNNIGIRAMKACLNNSFAAIDAFRSYSPVFRRLEQGMMKDTHSNEKSTEKDDCDSASTHIAAARQKHQRLLQACGCIINTVTSIAAFLNVFPRATASSFYASGLLFGDAQSHAGKFRSLHTPPAIVNAAICPRISSALMEFLSASWKGDAIMYPSNSSSVMGSVRNGSARLGGGGGNNSISGGVHPAVGLAFLEFLTGGLKLTHPYVIDKSRSNTPSTDSNSSSGGGGGEKMQDSISLPSLLPFLDPSVQAILFHPLLCCTLDLIRSHCATVAAMSSSMSSSGSNSNSTGITNVGIIGSISGTVYDARMSVAPVSSRARIVISRDAAVEDGLASLLLCRPPGSSSSSLSPSIITPTSSSLSRPSLALSFPPPPTVAAAGTARVLHVAYVLNPYTFGGGGGGGGRSRGDAATNVGGSIEERSSISQKPIKVGSNANMRSTSSNGIVQSSKAIRPSSSSSSSDFVTPSKIKVTRDSLLEDSSDAVFTGNLLLDDDDGGNSSLVLLEEGEGHGPRKELFALVAEESIRTHSSYIPLSSMNTNTNGIHALLFLVPGSNQGKIIYVSSSSSSTTANNHNNNNNNNTIPQLRSSIESMIPTPGSFIRLSHSHLSLQQQRLRSDPWEAVVTGMQETKTETEIVFRVVFDVSAPSTLSTTKGGIPFEIAKRLTPMLTLKVSPNGRSMYVPTNTSKMNDSYAFLGYMLGSSLVNRAQLPYSTTCLPHFMFASFLAENVVEYHHHHHHGNEEGLISQYTERSTSILLEKLNSDNNNASASTSNNLFNTLPLSSTTLYLGLDAIESIDPTLFTIIQQVLGYEMKDVSKFQELLDASDLKVVETTSSDNNGGVMRIRVMDQDAAITLINSTQSASKAATSKTNNNNTANSIKSNDKQGSSSLPPLAPSLNASSSSSSSSSSSHSFATMTISKLLPSLPSSSLTQELLRATKNAYIAHMISETVWDPYAVQLRALRTGFCTALGSQGIYALYTLCGGSIGLNSVQLQGMVISTTAIGSGSSSSSSSTSSTLYSSPTTPSTPTASSTPSIALATPIKSAQVDPTLLPPAPNSSNNSSGAPSLAKASSSSTFQVNGRPLLSNGSNAAGPPPASVSTTSASAATGFSSEASQVSQHAPLLKKQRKQTIRDIFRVVFDEEVEKCTPLRSALWSCIEDNKWIYSTDPATTAALDAAASSLQQAFVRFVTGIGSLPPILKSEVLRIECPQIAFSAKEHRNMLQSLPVAHTCTNTLEIPNYYKAAKAVLSREEALQMIAQLSGGGGEDEGNQGGEDAEAVYERLTAVLLASKLLVAITSTEGYGLDNT